MSTHICYHLRAGLVKKTRTQSAFSRSSPVQSGPVQSSPSFTTSPNLGPVYVAPRVGYVVCSRFACQAYLNLLDLVNGLNAINMASYINNIIVWSLVRYQPSRVLKHILHFPAFQAYLSLLK